jgi:hypothetical protein
MARAVDAVERMWREQREELARERRRNGFDLAQAMRDYEQTELDGDGTRPRPADLRRRARNRLAKLRERAARMATNGTAKKNGWQQAKMNGWKKLSAADHFTLNK